MGAYVNFFVKVEGSAHSGHRSPEGIYAIDVIDQAIPLKHSATAALNCAINNIPFLADDLNRFSLHIFLSGGEEIATVKSIPNHIENLACYCGRVIEGPDSIN